jgi:hypothetical protein
MKMSLSVLGSALLLVSGPAAAAEVAFEFDSQYLTPPEGMDTIGNGHGEIRVDSAGNIYVSVERQEEGGLQVYSPEGKFLRYVPNAPGSLHGFVIHQEEGGEFIYAAVLGQTKVIKMTLEGEIVLEIPTSAFPTEHAGPKGLKLTNCDVAPNGDIYVVDGYGMDWIYIFDKTGKFKKAFGGRGEPLKLTNCHKMFIDTRYDEPRVLLCDRVNLRLVHTDLDGNLIGVYAEGLRRPSSADFHGDLVCIAEIAGSVTVLDKAGKVVATLGANDVKGESNTPKVEPKDWRTGVVTSPHGIAFDNDGNILETEWNVFGRVLRWLRK